MELVSFAKEILQNVAEHVASYKIGQSLLRQVDRALWVVEKSARWAVPPPLDQDEPQPELVRPLPWVFFLTLLIVLRVTRESLSLVNLVLGKPPVRSIDVVAYVQSKRRYLRTLKYQGNRLMRARTSAPPSPTAPRPWHESLRSLFEFTMCFRRNSYYGNNNSTQVTNNEEILVVKRKRSRPEEDVTAPTASEDPMDRLIEKMMVDLNAESDEDSSITLTHAASLKSVESDEIVDENTTMEKKIETPFANNEQTSNGNHHISTTDTPEDEPVVEAIVNSTQEKEEKTETPETTETKNSLSEPEPEQRKKLSPKTQTMAFIQQEKLQTRKSQKKIANGQASKGSSRKQKGLPERRESDVPVVRITPADSFERENIRRST